MRQPKVKNRHGGPRPNSGRPPNWFKAKCAAIVDKKKLLDFVGRVAEGLESDHRLSEGVVVELPASIHDRLYAVEMLCDRGFGKPVQAVSGVDGGPLVIQMVNYGGQG